MFRKPECPVAVPDPFEGKVKCKECKHYIDRGDAQEVVVRHEPWFGYCAYDNGRRTEHYCPLHIRPYDRAQTWPSVRFFKEFEVSEKGVPFEYVRNATPKNK